MKRVLMILLCVAMLVMCACEPKAANPSGATDDTSVTATAEATQEPVVTPPAEPSPSAEAKIIPPESLPKFELEQYPRVDGSTANIPLIKQLIMGSTGISDDEAEALSQVSTTPRAYTALINDLADLLIVYEPSEGTKAEIKESGVEVEYIPIGRDALVFLANETNRADNLTTQQLIDIYTGKITNWKDVGGQDQKIEAYQRDADSGSQSLFIKLLMKDIKPMQPLAYQEVAAMSGLIDVIASFNEKDANAIGYSVYYYAKNMYEMPGVKLISVDGTEPSNQSIKDGIYPFVNEFYAVIRKDAPEDSPARKLAVWLATADGKQLIEDCGYVAVK